MKIYIAGFIYKYIGCIIYHESYRDTVVLFRKNILRGYVFIKLPLYFSFIFNLIKMCYIFILIFNFYLFYFFLYSNKVFFFFRHQDPTIFMRVTLFSLHSHFFNHKHQLDYFDRK